MQNTASTCNNHDSAFKRRSLNLSALGIIALMCFIFLPPYIALADDQFDQLRDEIAERCTKNLPGPEKLPGPNMDSTLWESIKVCIRSESERLKDKVNKGHADIVFGGHTQQSILNERSLQKAQSIAYEKSKANYEVLVIRHQKLAINIIKEHYLNPYTEKQGYPPFGKAMEQFFSKPSWEASLGNYKNCWIVEFNGIAKWGQNNARFTWKFTIEPEFKNGKLEGYSFNYTAKVNGNSVSAKIMNDMLGTIYLN